MNLIFIYICFFSIFKIKYVESAEILAMIPLPFPSHFTMYKKILEGLAEKGHNVDVVTSFTSNKKIAGLNYIPVSKVQKKITNFNVRQLRELTLSGILNLMFGDKFCNQFFVKEEMKKIRDSPKKYDLLIVELFTADCFFGYANIFKIPTIAMTSSVNLPWGIGRGNNPENPAFIPNYFGDFTPEMNLWQRFINTYFYVYTKLFHFWDILEQNRIAKEFFRNDLDLEDIVNNCSLFILNSHFSLNEARPKFPNVLEVGGVHIKEPKPLQKNFSDIIQGSKFIYFSLGSLAKPETISPEILQQIFSTFEKLQYKILWKGDSEKIPKNLKIPSNIHFNKWLPQLDILCDANLVLFITHSGLLSTQEAVYCGVPILSIPLFADQFLNSMNMVEKKVGIQVNLEEIGDKLYGAIRELIGNTMYKKNMMKLSYEFRDRPQNPLQETIYWIEYVLKYKGAPQLRSTSVNLF